MLADDILIRTWTEQIIFKNILLSVATYILKFRAGFITLVI